MCLYKTMLCSTLRSADYDGSLTEDTFFDPRSIPSIMAEIETVSRGDTIITPTSFPLFPKLPDEIKVMIFKHVFLVQRTIQITAAKDKRYFQCKNPVPALFHVCKLSRTEALKSYSLLFRWKSRKFNAYFNLAVDCLDIGDLAFSSQFVNLEHSMGFGTTRKIRYLRLDAYRAPLWLQTIFLPLFFRFRGVEHFTFCLKTSQTSTDVDCLTRMLKQQIKSKLDILEKSSGRSFPRLTSFEWSTS